MDQFDDGNIIARTCWAEARSDGQEGMHAVLNSGQNRLSSGRTWWGSTLRGIFLYPYQYSCWNSSDPNRSQLLSVTEEDPLFVIALQLADQAIAGTLFDIVQGSDSYFNPAGAAHPSWAKGDPVVIIKHHWFYKTV